MLLARMGGALDQTLVEEWGPGREPLLSHQPWPKQMIDGAVSQVPGRNTETSDMDEPLIHAVRAQKQCGIFGDTLPKRRVDHHKITVDRPALLATIVAEISPVFMV